ANGALNRKRKGLSLCRTASLSDPEIDRDGDVDLRGQAGGYPRERLRAAHRRGRLAIEHVVPGPLIDREAQNPPVAIEQETDP
ncbi:UNVERIFIED_CONTAM: hypothetical protein NY100_27070, partial [Prevotella sp. 15_C9]